MRHAFVRRTTCVPFLAALRPRLACMLVSLQPLARLRRRDAKRAAPPTRLTSGRCEGTNHTPRRREQQKSHQRGSLWHKR